MLRRAWTNLLLAGDGLPAVLTAALIALSPIAAAPAEAAGTPYGKGLLWRIEGAGKAPSYVFGTIHLTDERVRKLPEPVAQTFANARSLTVEIARSKDMPLRVARLMMLQNGNRLSDILGPELFQDAAEAAAPFGIPAAVLERLKPWAAFVSFAVPPEEGARQRQGILPMDHELQAIAQRRGLPVHSLETIEEQLGVFDSLSNADQIGLLRNAIRDSKRMNQIFGAMVRYYLARDIGGLLGWMSEQTAGDDPRLRDVYHEKLLYARNKTMVKRMRPRLAEGNAFIAVGAAHLPGEKGVLKLLANQGYKVTRVY